MSRNHISDRTDFPSFLDGKRAGLTEDGQPYVLVGDRKWILAPGEKPIEPAPEPAIFREFPPPPRRIGWSTKLSLVAGTGNGILFLVGMIFLCFGMMFVCVFLGSGVIDTYGSWTKNGEATITKIESAHFKINENAVARYHYTGKDEQGRAIDGVSYQFGEIFQENQTVPLERISFGGDKWRLEGGWCSPVGNSAGYFSLLTLLFPLAGFCTLLFGVILPGLRKIPPLTFGETALASFDRIVSTSVAVNGRNVQKMIYEFETPDGETYEASLKTLEPERFLKQNERKIVFYNPANPGKNIIWEDVADLVKYDSHSQTFSGMSFRVIPLFLCTVIFAVEILWFLRNVVTGSMF